MLEDQARHDFVELTTLIASRDVFAFAWCDSFWVPMFQFELRDLSVRRGAKSVLAELLPIFDGWALAAWYAKPNPWLNDRRPVDTLDSYPQAVLEAARADRFVANG